MSDEFEALRRDNKVVAHSDGVKRICHPGAGLVKPEFCSAAVVEDPSSE